MSETPLIGLMERNSYGVTTFYAGTRVVFGEGAVDRMGEHIDFARSVLVITGTGSALRHGHLERLKKALGRRDKIVVISNASPNPRLREVEEAAARGMKENVDCVIGLGGGSAMDAAKGVAAAIGNGGRITDLFRSGAPAPANSLPVICVPTTAGTGSETSKGAILSDEERGVKGGLRGEGILPRLAVVDPELTYSLPPRITAETGFDVLTHAVETWVSRKSSPFVGLFSRHAIAVVHRWLPRLLQVGSDRDARRELSFACLLMGYNLANSSTCLPHRLQYPIGALTDTSHPAGLAALYPAWCENTYSAAPAVFDYLGVVLGGRAADVPELMTQFLDALDIRYSLKQLGVREDDLEKLAGAVSGNLGTDPGDTSPGALLDLYRRSWDIGG